MSQRLLQLVLLCCLLVAPAWSQEPPPDVHIVIDMSGSMKETDPKNLRTPALKLMVNLLPERSSAGVWTFGQWVNMAVPPRQVDASWRRQANNAADKIHSEGLYTALGSAMEKAIYPWYRPDSNAQRSMVILTDGMVDISTNPSKNAQERRRILDDVLPKVKALGIKVHTIALSQQADSELLRTLSSTTEGLFQQVDDADQLQRVFLRVFEQSAPRDTVPLVDNRFQIDASIEEYTALIFYREDAKPGLMISPSGKRYGKGAHPESIRWHSEGSFDVVTVTKPEVGEWRILADSDPDNRVMVVTQLGLKMSALPSAIFVNETLPIKAWLNNANKVITRPEFHAVTNVTLQQQLQEQALPDRIFADNGKSPDEQAGDGYYGLNLIPEQGGDWSLAVVAQGPTYQRQMRRTLQVHTSPINLSVQREMLGRNVLHYLLAEAKADLVRPESMSIWASVQSPDGKTRYVQVEPDSAGGPGQWRLLLHDGNDQLDFTVALEVNGQTLSGREFKAQLPPRTLSTELDADLAPIEGADAAIVLGGNQPEPEAAAEPAVEPEPDAAPTVPEAEPEPAATAEDETPEPAVTPEPAAEEQAPQPAEPEPAEAEQIALPFPATLPEETLALPQNEPPAADDEAVNWWLVGGIVGGVNLALALFGGLGFWLVRRRRRQAESQLETLFDEGDTLDELGALAEEARDG